MINVFALDNGGLGVASSRIRDHNDGVLLLTYNGVGDVHLYFLVEGFVHMIE